MGVVQPTAGKERNKQAVLTRIMCKAWGTEPDLNGEQLPGALSNEPIISTNNAGTGYVNLIKSNAADIVELPNASGVIVDGPITHLVATTHYLSPNYISSETGANNALVAALTDTAGNAVTVAAGLRIAIKIAHSLQAGGNTLNLNSHGTDAIKSHNNPGNNIGTAYVSGSIVDLMFDGTVWQDMSQ